MKEKDAGTLEHTRQSCQYHVVLHQNRGNDSFAFFTFVGLLCIFIPVFDKQKLICYYKLVYEDNSSAI